MIKNIIAPIQMWLLSQGRCVGCGNLLTKGSVEKKKDYFLTTCNCGRIYIQVDRKSNYKRAKLSQI